MIQAVVLAQLGGLTVPNPYGDLPLLDGDPARPNEAYFRHVDYVVNKAEELGLFVGMLPTWGSYWASGQSVFTPASARQYGRYLGNRYRDRAIIWILGGDRSITNTGERASGPVARFQHVPVVARRARPRQRALRRARLRAHAREAHPRRRAPLRGNPRRLLQPGRGRMERFDDYDVRQAAYWSLLAGACGHTYGNNNVWQMFEPGVAGPDDAARRDLFGGPGGNIGANVPWPEALDHPGALQMRHVRRLFESLPFTRLVPDQRIVLNGPTTGGARIRAARASDGSFALVYSPRGEGFTLDKSLIRSERQQQFWYDPRYGTAYPLKEQDSWGIQTFAPPSSGRGNDWVLLLVDAAAGFPVPGGRTAR